MEKLEYLKEIKQQTNELEETKQRLKQFLKDDQDEGKIMQFFQKEKERLAGERDELTEFLKQINHDISIMDTMINQTESEHSKSYEATKRLLEDYMQRRSRINKLRSQLSLPNLENDNFLENLDLIDLKNGISNEWHGINQQTIRSQMLNNQSSLAARKTENKPLQPRANSNLNYGHHSDQNIPSLNVERRIERTMSSSFVQQPPPMKTCMSCNQQIHRNAPICPYCKAKSRSRNPKKPKRKIDS